MKRIARQNRILVVLVVALVVAAVLALSFSDAGVAYAGSYGGKDYSTLWYANSLDIATAKAVIATWNLDELKKNPVVIACIDTGINASSTGGHEIFDGVLTKDSNGNLLGWNSYTAVYEGPTAVMDVSDESNLGDNSFHGTKVAGVMAMLIKELGLQDCIKIYTIKANTPGKNSFKLNSIINAIERASGEAVGASVINLSLAIQGSGDGEEWRTNQTFQKAIKDAAKSAVVVAAANNNSKDSATSTPYYPAAHEGVLGVMALASNGTSLHSTSNYGGAYDIVAPGEDIYTATTVVGSVNNYKTFGGTSAASPFVSVAAALLKLRYIQEGKLKVENGVQTPSGVKFETMLANLDSARVEKGSYSFRTLDLGKVLTQDFSNTQYDYVNPSEITLEGDGIYGSGEYSQAYYQRADEIVPINFSATLLPLGKVDPNLEASVEWRVKEIKENDEDDDDENSELDINVKLEKTYGAVWGHGLEFAFRAPHGGDWVVTAVLRTENNTLSVYQRVHVEYLPYYSGNVRVTTIDHASDFVDDAPSTATIYANQWIKFSLTGIEYVDQTVGIRWYVNGEEVKNANGETYINNILYFLPKKAGTYVISAQYGNRGEIVGEYTFTLVVKPTMANPEYISMVCVGGVLVIAAAVVIPLVLRKRKLAAKSADEKKEEPQDENQDESSLKE
ncbi:MAG: S8/S53 family peptidase [Clostridia bacterium]|nr:S8/S53 family peptidase [Clostridia bacterium]